MCVWAVLTAGTTVSGGLMMLAGQGIPPERNKIEIQAYFIGGLNIVTALVAVVLFCTGVLLPKFRKSAGYRELPTSPAGATVYGAIETGSLACS